MLHKSASAEQELADAYLELNLGPEAAAIYERIIPTFAGLGLRAEQARALAACGRAGFLLGRLKDARVALSSARELYASEGNTVGEALVTLTEAQVCHAEGDFAGATRLASLAEGPLLGAWSWERALLARWLRGEAARAMGEAHKLEALFKETLRDGRPSRLTPACVALEYETILGRLTGTVAGEHDNGPRFYKSLPAYDRLKLLLTSGKSGTMFFRMA